MSTYFEFLPEELYGTIISFILDPDAVDLLNLLSVYPRLKDKLVTSFLINQGVYSSFKAASEYFDDDILNLFLETIKYAVGSYDYSDDNFMQKYHSMVDNLCFLPKDLFFSRIIFVIWIYKNYPLIYNYIKNDPKGHKIELYLLIKFIKILDNIGSFSFSAFIYLNERHIIEILKLRCVPHRARS